MNSYDLPPQDRYVRLELTNNEYLNLFMQNNPVHDNDQEKAANIV